MSDLKRYGRIVEIHDANKQYDYINLDSIKAIFRNGDRTKVYLDGNLEVSFSSPTLDELLELLAE